MDVNKHVIDYESGLKLKKLGVKQDSLFFWCFPEGATTPQLMNFSIYNFRHDNSFEAHLKENECSAFMISELMDLMPDKSVDAALANAVSQLQRHYSPSV